MDFNTGLNYLDLFIYIYIYIYMSFSYTYIQSTLSKTDTFGTIT